MHKKKILLADDDDDDRTIFKDFLRNRKDIVILPFAKNGVEVIELLEAATDIEYYPDIIILDHNMPKMNGKQTLQWLKSSKKYKSITVFIYTTYVDTSLMEQCNKLGAAMVTSKPTTRKGYEQMIDECLKLLPA